MGRFLLFLILVTSGLQAAKKTVCVNMIVKNESTVIKRCLESVLPIIDYWVICDTGSTDGTQEIIKSYMLEKNVPGELHERPWVNFGHNRNEALELARGKADYVLFIDADEYLVYEKGFRMPELDKDYYYLTLTWPGASWKKISLLNMQLDWEWLGVLHEVITPAPERTSGTIEKVKNIYTLDGARAKDPKKYEKDCEVLEAALKEDPNNSRNLFYLAKSYQNAGNLEKALEVYQKRCEIGGQNDAEAFWSMLQVALLQEQLHKPPGEVIASLKRACKFTRCRAEPFYHLSRYYRERGDYLRSYFTASLARNIPIPQDSFFIDRWIYEFGLPMELSVSSFWTGRYKECQALCLGLLSKPDLPPNFRQTAEFNLGFTNEKLLAKICDG